MKSSSEPAFTVVDKRGQAHIETPAPVSVESEEKVDRSFWKSTDLQIVLNNVQGALFVIGRAIGLRSDDCLFCGDYILAPRWPKDLDWPREARKRLDTFLNCNCTIHGPCIEHELNIPKWTKADMERLNLIAMQPKAEVIQFMEKVEMARRTHIVPAKGLIK